MTLTMLSEQDTSGGLEEMIETLQTLLWMERERADALKQALRAARRTGIAVGLLMARDNIDETEAFSRLLKSSTAGPRHLQETVEKIIAR